MGDKAERWTNEWASEWVGAFSRNGTRQSKLACAIWQIVSMENLTISDG